MDDLISRAAAIDAAIDGADDWDGGYNPERERYIREHMAKVLAVDAVPVVHGRWRISDTELWQRCSECGVAVERESMYMCKASEDDNFNYCPHCGAKMIGERRDDDGADA